MWRDRWKYPTAVQWQGVIIGVMLGGVAAFVGGWLGMIVGAL